MADKQAVEADAALLEFLASLADYTPTIPDELAEHYLSRSGFQSPDIRVTRLMSVAAQKFIGEIASDAMQFCKIRLSNASKEKRDKGQTTKEKRLVMTTEDLAAALAEYGVNVRKQEYYADAPVAAGTAPKDKNTD